MNLCDVVVGAVRGCKNNGTLVRWAGGALDVTIGAPRPRDLYNDGMRRLSVTTPPLHARGGGGLAVYVRGRPFVRRKIEAHSMGEWGWGSPSYTFVS